MSKQIVTRYDTVAFPTSEWTDEGYLKDKPIVTAVGIFEYQNENGSIRRELRLPEHVFDKESLESYKGKPVIITHSAGVVTTENVSDEIIGTILSDGIEEGENVRADIIIHDTEALKKSGMKELSLGYNLVLDETQGEWNGEHYDAIQTEIRINHLAVVKQARAGEQARLNIDSKDQNKLLKGKKTMATKKKSMNADELKVTIEAFEKRRKARLDGEDEPPVIPERVTVGGGEEPKTDDENGGENPAASGEITLEEKVQQIKDKRVERDKIGDPADVEGAKGVIAQQDEDISALMELLAKLQAAKDFADKPANEDDSGSGEEKGEEKTMNADSVDKLIAEHLKLVRIGDKLNLDGIETMKPLDAKKKIITAINPKIRLDGKGAVYVDAAFDLAMQELTARKTTDDQRKQIFNSDNKDTKEKSGAYNARQKMCDKMLYGEKE